MKIMNRRAEVEFWASDWICNSQIGYAPFSPDGAPQTDEIQGMKGKSDGS